jgi:2-amino-4-hydroxy-6-hydroxymethyldihydropteridine diphosphokinase
MGNVYVLIGGNLGNREENLSLAVHLLGQQAGTVINKSLIYETAAWGITDQASFLNQALEMTTYHDPETFLQLLLSIEKQMGRNRKEKNGPRIIDIDILFFGNAIISLPLLKVPHPELENRRFALVPMKEIAPQFIHPVLKKTVNELLNDCPDKLDVRPFPVNEPIVRKNKH